MNNNTNLTDALAAELRSLKIRIQSLEFLIEQDAANIVASANSLQRDILAGFVRADNGGFVSSHMNSYMRNASEMQSLQQQQQVLQHIIETTTEGAE